MLTRFFVFVAVVLLPGCSKTSDKLPELHPVKGTITKNGVAVKPGYVRFDPESDQEYTVQGPVDAGGAFELETIRGDKRSKGAPAGVYKVFYIPDGGADQLASTPIETTTTYTVEAKSNEITIELMAK